MLAHALSRFGLRFSRALLLLALICFSFASARAAAAEIVVKNDTVFGPGYPATPNPLPNEHDINTRLGAWLTWFPIEFGVSDAGNLSIRAIIQPVPEPSTCALAASGLVGLLVARRRKSPA